MKLDARMSPDRRLRTESYKTSDGENFCIAEETLSGTLITEFKSSGEVVNQVFAEKRDAPRMLSEYLGGTTELNIKEANMYERVKIKATCTKCGGENIERLMDQQEARSIREIPVVPLFLCKSCGSKFYSMSDAYLRQLISRKESLFEAKEMSERNINEDKFVKTLQEYIIRIFASKKIQRLKIKG
jgi:ribosomal protein L44E